MIRTALVQFQSNYKFINIALVQFQSSYKHKIEHWCNSRAVVSSKYGTGAMPEQLQAQNTALVQFQSSYKLNIWH